MRAYEESHPWIDFAIDLTNPPYRLWLLLGEARSKVQHIAGVPLRPETATELHKVYLVKGVQATAAIEGNTLTEQQVMAHVEGKLRLPPSQQYLEQEVKNVIAAVNRIGQEIFEGRPSPFTVNRITDFNRHVLEGLKLEEGVVPGEFRTYPVGVARYRGVAWEDCPYLVERLCEWLNGPDLRSSDPELDIAYAIVRAVAAHLYLVWIHPFGDGNGRTARLMEFQILTESGVPTPAAHLLSNHYNQTRSEYYQQLDRASRSPDGFISFLYYAVEGFVDQLRQQLEFIQVQQMAVAWENYVHERFQGERTAVAVRRRHLVLDLSDLPGPVPRAGLPALTPRLAKAYAGKTTKTLSRDLNVLLEMELIRRVGGGYVAASDVIRAFLPGRVQPAVPLPRRRRRRSNP